MKYFTLILFGLLVCSFNLMVHFSGAKTIQGDDPTIVDAVSDQNLQGVGSGGTIFNIVAYYSETTAAITFLNTTGTVSIPIVLPKRDTGEYPLISAFRCRFQYPPSLTMYAVIYSKIG